jgi:hypothetical protein
VLVGFYLKKRVQKAYVPCEKHYLIIFSLGSHYLVQMHIVKKNLKRIFIWGFEILILFSINLLAYLLSMNVCIAVSSVHWWFVFSLQFFFLQQQVPFILSFY